MMAAMAPSVSSSVRARRHSPSRRCTRARSSARPGSPALPRDPPSAPPRAAVPAAAPAAEGVPGAEEAAAAAASAAAALVSSFASCCTPANASCRAPVAHTCFCHAYITSGSWLPGDRLPRPRASASARTQASRRTRVASLWLMRPLLRHRLANLSQVAQSSCISSIRRRTLEGGAEEAGEHAVRGGAGRRGGLAEGLRSSKGGVPGSGSSSSRSSRPPQQRLPDLHVALHAAQPPRPHRLHQLPAARRSLQRGGQALHPAARAAAAAGRRRLLGAPHRQDLLQLRQLLHTQHVCVRALVALPHQRRQVSAQQVARSLHAGCPGRGGMCCTLSTHAAAARRTAPLYTRAHTHTNEQPSEAGGA
jgi:hypothetical protein